MEPIGKDLDGMLARLGMPTAVDLTALVSGWEEVAGEPFAGLAKPVGLKGGELVLEVPDGATASLLKYRVGLLLDRLWDHFGEGVVDRVKIRLSSRKK